MKNCVFFDTKIVSLRFFSGLNSISTTLLVAVVSQCALCHGYKPCQQYLLEIHCPLDYREGKSV